MGMIKAGKRPEKPETKAWMSAIYKAIEMEQLDSLFGCGVLFCCFICSSLRDFFLEVLVGDLGTF